MHKLKRLEKEIGMEDVIASLHYLPSIPGVVQELVSSFGSAELDVDALSYKIGQDQGLSAKLLRVANSAFYGLPRQVRSIREAVVVLGFDTVRSLVMAAGFIHAFPQRQGIFDRQAFWRKSFRVGEHAKALARALKLNRETAFTAGLFHDLGQLVLDVCLREQFEAVLEAARASGLGLIKTEQAMLGFDHAMIGAEAARRWNFPHEIEDAIRYHHSPGAAQFEPITALVHVAVLLAGDAGEEAPGYDGDSLAGQAEQILGIEWSKASAFLPEPEQLDAAASLLLAA